MTKILVTSLNYEKYCAEAVALLKKHNFEVIFNTEPRPLEFEEIINLIEEVDGVIAGNDTWDEPIFQKATKLKVIARVGVGYDNIDVNKATEYGITVSNARAHELSIGVAELAIGLIINILRDIPRLSYSIRSGNWNKSIGRELNGMTVGLVGFGAIGQTMAKLLSGFDVNILAYDKYPNLDKAKELNTQLVSFEDLLVNSDIVSLHLPNTSDTFRLFGERQFQLMKKGAYFINTARGALVDEEALFFALTSNHLTAAATDVFNNEPVSKNNPLLTLDNILCTQHIGGDTWETRTSIGLIAAKAVINTLEGRKPEFALN